MLNFSQRTIFLVICATLFSPILALFFSWTDPAVSVWLHLLATVLPNYLVNSVALAAMVGTGTLFLGASAGYLVARHSFPGKRFLQWAIVMPFAFPPYLLAYIYGQVLQFGGPLHIWVLDQSSLAAIHFLWPSVRNIWGCALVFIVSLTPYVYLLARAHFLHCPRSAEEAATLLGASRFQVHAKVLWPLAWPTLAGGVVLVLMEVLADFGTAEHMAVETLSTGVFRTWYGLGSAAGAAQLASGVAVLVFFLLFLQRKLRAGKSFAFSKTKNVVPSKTTSKFLQSLAMILFITPCTLGFILPFFYLLRSFLQAGELPQDFFPTVTRSFFVAGGSASVCLALGFFLALFARSNPKYTWVSQSAASGYAFPGAILATGVLILGKGWESAITFFSSFEINLNSLPMWSGTLSALIFAYLVRFVALPFQNCTAAYVALRPGYDDAAKTLGATPFQIVRFVHWPQLLPFLWSSWFLVFVDVLKELPATLMLRPFGFETLAVRVYTLASDERLKEASAYALLLVCVGFCMIWVLARSIQRKEIYDTQSN